jgi:lipid-binding SYLF domain-containing protein
MINKEVVMNKTAVRFLRLATRPWYALAMVVVGLWISAPHFSRAAEGSEARALINQADVTLKNFLMDPDMTSFKDALSRSRAIYIMPKLVKGAFVFGVEGGNGILLARDEKTGAWSQPLFYETSAGSFGLQAGAQSQEAIMLVMTTKGVESLLTSNVKLGVDGAVAMGPKGIGSKGSTTPNFNADYLTFARAQGLFAGVSFDGAVVRIRDPLNAAFYGEGVRPTDVVIARNVRSNPYSRVLHDRLTAAVPMTAASVPEQ